MENSNQNKPEDGSKEAEGKPLRRRGGGQSGSRSLVTADDKGGIQTAPKDALERAEKVMPVLNTLQQKQLQEALFNNAMSVVESDTENHKATKQFARHREIIRLIKDLFQIPFVQLVSVTMMLYFLNVTTLLLQAAKQAGITALPSITSLTTSRRLSTSAAASLLMMGIFKLIKMRLGK